jgi:hypothetical protein
MKKKKMNYNFNRVKIKVSFSCLDLAMELRKRLSQKARHCERSEAISQI